MSERQKILWLVSWYPNRDDPFDGDFIQRHARAAAIYHDIHVIFVKPSDEGDAVEEVWNYATGLSEQIIYFNKPAGLLAKWRKQIIWKSLFQDSIKKYIGENGKPICVHVHIPWKSGLIALWMKKKYGLPFIITEHWGNYDKDDRDGFINQRSIVKTLLRRIYYESFLVTTVSMFLANSIQKLTGRKTDIIIPNVVDTTLFYYKPGKYSKFSFIHVSNMADWKQVDGIIEAFGKFISMTGKTEVQLILIGNKNEKYVQTARESGLYNSSVFFLGEISYQEVAKELRRSHCHVLFGNKETFSCVTAEALCAGLPVIVPNAGAVPDLVNSGNGIVINPDDTDGLAMAMKKVHEDYDGFNPEVIAREAALKYSYQRVSEEFRILYEKLGPINT
jgi:glycosyltransferase involved in cell wall biosynthesis